MNRLYVIIVLLFTQTDFSSAQTWVWGRGEKNLNSRSNCYVSSLAVDSLGNIYEAGGYWDRDIFGSDTLPNEGQNGNAFLVKYDGTGNEIWALSSILVDTANDWATINSVATDKTGNVYVVGEINGTAIFNKDSVKSKGFLIKYNTAGNLSWVEQLTNYVNWVTIDTKCNIYITFQNSANIQKFDSSGNTIWISTAKPTGSGYGEGLCIATDNFGHIYLSGMFNTKLVLGKDTVANTSTFYDGFIAKYDTAGNEIWAKGAITNYECQFNSLATDNEGNVYVTGRDQDSMTIGGYTFNGGTDGDAFLIKYNPNGNIIWAQAAILKGSPGYSLADGYSVCTDKQQNVYLSGTFEDTMIMGGGQLVIGNINWYGDDPAYIYKFDSSGRTLCNTSVGRDDNNYCGVVADPLGDNAYFAGEAFYLTTCTFGSNTFDGGGYDYGFLAKWTCGGPQSIEQVQSISNVISVYPNPSTGITNYELGITNYNCRIEIFNMLGGNIYNAELKSTTGQIDLSNQPNGIYLYRITSEKGELVGSGKLIIH